MAKKAYIGVDGVARKVKKGYIGVDADLPIYSEETNTVAITADNIAEYFVVTNGSYYFVGSGSTFTTNNGGVNSSTASTVLKAKQDISALSFSYSYSSESNYDKFTLNVGGTTVESAVSGATTSKTYSGSLTKDQTIEFSYTKDSSQDKNDDQCTFSAMSITCTVRTQIGTETKSVARKIKKAYIGIGGVARPCWSGGELVYYGTVASLSNTARSLAATHFDDYALFGGGSPNRKTVNSYNKNLVKSTVTPLAVARWNLAATAIAGRDSTDHGSNYVDYYDTSLTHGYNRSLIGGSFGLNATTNGSYAIIGGGSSNSDGSYEITWKAVDSSLTSTVLETGWTNLGCNYAAANIGKNAIFAGGYYTSNNDTVISYNENLVFTKLTSLTTKRSSLAGASSEKYVLFAGGYSGSAVSSVDAYDENLTKISVTPMKQSRSDLAGTNIGKFIIFTGGNNGSLSSSDTDSTMSPYATVEVYDENLTLLTFEGSISRGRGLLAATNIGEYALFGGGGYGISTSFNTVDAFTIA